MDPLAEIARRAGVFLTQEAYAAGYDDRTIAAAVRHRAWHRVRQGAFVPMPVWLDADAEARHRILVRAVWRSYGDRVAISHVSAALEHGMTVWDHALDRVHVTRLDGGSARIERDVVHHIGRLEPDQLCESEGMVMTTAVRSAVDLATVCDVEHGLVTLDSGLRHRMFDADVLGAAYASMQRWPGTRHVRVAVRLADGGAESAGESRFRYLCYVGGLPRPQLQCPVYDAHGELIGWTDFAWHERRMLGEFDGRAKYGRLLKPGQEPGDVVFAEKLREDALREATGYGMVRVIWANLDTPSRTIARLARSLGASVA